MKANWTPIKASVVTVLVCAGVIAGVVATGLVPVSGKQDAHGNPGEGHEEPDKHGADDEEGARIRLTPEQRREFDIRVEQAGPGTIHRMLRVPAEIGLNEDRVAHVVPRVGGIVVAVKKALGDKVTEGEVLAVLESRPLADAKTVYLSAVQRLVLAKANFVRIEKLHKEGILPEKSYLEARQQLAEAEIESRSTEQKLHTLGLSEEDLKELPKQSEVNFTRFEIKAPFAGEITEKHITLGEVLTDETNAFVIADLVTVWVNLTIYTPDLPLVRVGQEATLQVPGKEERPKARIFYLGPTVDESTRTVLARLTLPNPHGHWRPGLFLTADITLSDGGQVKVAVPVEAVLGRGDKKVVFVEKDGVFEPRPVKVGVQSSTLVEILYGVKPGESIVTKGNFLLKSELDKERFEGGH